MAFFALKKVVRSRLIACHRLTPGVRKLPLPAVAIVIALVFANAIVWVAVGILLVWPIRHVSLYAPSLMQL